MLLALCVMPFFFISLPTDKEIKIVYVDGTLKDGVVRSVRGRILDEDDTSITIERSNGTLVVGKSFIIKIENWTVTRWGFNYR